MSGGENFTVEELLQRLTRTVNSDVASLVSQQAELKATVHLLEHQIKAESRLIQQKMDSKIENLEGRIEEIHKVVIRGNGRESLTVTVGRLDEKFAQRGAEIQELKADIKDLREIVDEVADEIQLWISKNNSSLVPPSTPASPPPSTDSKASSISVLGMQMEIWKIVVTALMGILTLASTAWVNDWSGKDSSGDKPPAIDQKKD